MPDLKKANEGIAHAVTSGFQKIEDGVTGGYQKIEAGATGGFRKVEDWFVGQFLTREGETVAEAKARLEAEQAAREGAAPGAKHVSGQTVRTAPANHSGRP